MAGELHQHDKRQFGMHQGPCRSLAAFPLISTGLGEEVRNKSTRTELTFDCDQTPGQGEGPKLVKITLRGSLEQ